MIFYLDLNPSKRYKESMNDKIVYILRGIPGSGKSTFAKECLSEPAFLVCSADDYFIGLDGVYHFDPKKIGEAHAACRKLFTTALESGYPYVMVDNTNTQLWEFKPYLDLAAQHGYFVRVVRLRCEDEAQARVFGARNSHGVPVDKVVQMFNRFEDFEGEDLV